MTSVISGNSIVIPANRLCQKSLRIFNVDCRLRGINTTVFVIPTKVGIYKAMWSKIKIIFFNSDFCNSLEGGNL